MIIVANFSELENSLLRKVSSDLDIAERCIYIEDDVCTADEFIAAFHAVSSSTQLPRVIIINLDSQEADWEALLRDLKRHDIWRFIPVMGLGFLENKDAVLKFYAAGGASCIEKPHGYDGLLKVTQAAMQYWLDVSFMPCDFMTDAA